MRSFIVFVTAASVASASGASTTEPSTIVTTVSTAAPLVLGDQAPADQLILPANTEITVTPNDDLSSKKLRKGDSFTVSTVYDVMLNGYVVIPRGSRGSGEVTWRTGKGAFGKSAKMDIELRWIDIGGRRLAIECKHRQEGEGNTGATIGAVVAVGVFGAFVTGKSASIPRGMQLTAHTTEALPVLLASATPAPQHLRIAPATAGVSQGTTPSQTSSTSAGASENNY